MQEVRGGSGCEGGVVEGDVEAGVEECFDIRHAEEGGGGGGEQDDGVGALAAYCRGEGFRGGWQGASGELGSRCVGRLFGGRGGFLGGAPTEEGFGVFADVGEVL